MPSEKYHCKNCGRGFETVRKASIHALNPDNDHDIYPTYHAE